MCNTKVKYEIGKMVQNLQNLGKNLSLNFWLKTFKWKTCVDASDYGIFSAENLTNSTAHIDEESI